MVAIHIPKSGKHYHYVTLFVISVFWMLSKRKGCMSSWAYPWHWKTNSYWKCLHVSYGNWMTSSIFLKDLCPVFLCFYSWLWLWSSCFLCHIKLHEAEVQEGAEWLYRKQAFLCTWHFLCMVTSVCTQCEKLLKSKLNKWMLTLLKNKLSEAFYPKKSRTEDNPHHIMHVKYSSKCPTGLPTR